MVSAGRLPVAIGIVRVEAPAGQAHRLFETAATGGSEIGILSHLVGVGDHVAEIATGEARLPALQPAMGGFSPLPRLVDRLAGLLAPRFAFLLVLDHEGTGRFSLLHSPVRRHRLDPRGIVDSRGFHGGGRGYHPRQAFMALDDKGEAGVKR